MEKRGQVTIFIIIAVVIVVSAVLIYMFYPNLKLALGFETNNPQEFLQKCLEDVAEEKVELISSQGGSLRPQHYFLYQGDKIEYLCYTEEYYKTCVVQKVLLNKQVEEEIARAIKEDADKCFQEMEKSFTSLGYSTRLNRGAMEVSLLPGKISISFNSTLNLEKEDSQRYDKFFVFLNNNLYELISIAENIVKWETNYGDAESTFYMGYYENVKVEKKKQTDGTTVYILTDRNNKKSFQFASRSVAWPPGYGFSGVYTGGTA